MRTAQSVSGCLCAGEDKGLSWLGWMIQQPHYGPEGLKDSRMSVDLWFFVERLETLGSDGSSNS